MRRMTETVSGVGTSPTLPMDFKAQIFNVGFGCEVTGTVTYSVQHTFDDIYTIPAGSLVWFNHEYVVAQTANMDGNYAFPISAMRLNVTAGTGSVTINVMQSSGQG
jgi:hypothetical protein